MKRTIGCNYTIVKLRGKGKYSLEPTKQLEDYERYLFFGITSNNKLTLIKIFKVPIRSKFRDNLFDINISPDQEQRLWQKT